MEVVASESGASICLVGAVIWIARHILEAKVWDFVMSHGAAVWIFGRLWGTAVPVI